MSVTIGAFSRVAIKAIASLALASVVLCQVAAHSGPPNGIAYVHVSTPEVDVLIDGQSHYVDTLWDSPIVCELPPGQHTLEMSRDGETLFEEEFTVRAADEIVLTAWDRRIAGGAKPASP
jgi:hypothetical protein